MTEEILRIFACQLERDKMNIEKIRLKIERGMYFLIVEMLGKGIELPEQGRLFLDRKLQQVKEELTNGRSNYEKRINVLDRSTSQSYRLKKNMRQVHETLRNLHRKICRIEKYRETNENTYFRETIGFLRPIYEKPNSKNH